MPTLITKAASPPSNPISLTGRCEDGTIIVTAYGKSRNFTNLIAAHTPGKDSIATLEIPPIYMTFPDYSEWFAKWLGGELKALDVATFWQDRPNSDRNVIRPGIITVFMEVYHEQTWRFSNIEASSFLTNRLQKEQLVLRDRPINLCLIAYRKSENPNSSRKLLPTILPMWSQTTPL
jgi:hypothetical protein